MAIATANLYPLSLSFSGGVDLVAPINENNNVVFGGTWAAGDNWTFELLDGLSGLQTQVGFGYASGVQPTFCFTFNDKIYVLGGDSVYCSAVGSPTTFNDPNALGDGFLELLNTQSSSETLLAMAQFQGYIAFWTRWSIQVWSINADLGQWQLIQSIPNMGTLSGRSVKSLGTGLDDLFLSDSGIRSLRVREVTLAGVIVDIGSPIDAFVKKALLAGNGGTACAVVEPLEGNYICYINPGGAGLAQAMQAIFCLSYFPSNKVVAWSTWDATDSASNYFIPQGFEIYKGQVWAYGLDNNGAPAIYQYGGPNNETYDATVCTAITPFMDGKTPGILKKSFGFEVVINAEYPSLIDTANAAYATWSMYATMNPQSVDANNLPQDWCPNSIYTGKTSTYDIDRMKFSDIGTHVSVKLVTSGTGPASLGSLTWHYNLAGEK
jgi:hypothetical protein